MGRVGRDTAWCSAAETWKSRIVEIVWITVKGFWDNHCQQTGVGNSWGGLFRVVR